MVPIIEPIDRALLRAELTPERKVRDTSRAGNEIYIFVAAECPNLMREVGRLREEAFRGAGGGTGEEVDIDAEDLADGGYYQLIVWDPNAEQIVGGYRFIVCTSEHPRHLSTEHYFHFSDRFRRRYLPYTIELGRSFVQPIYQTRGNAKSIYALDNLWDGLGALTVVIPDVKYLFGKVTMYPSYLTKARDMILYFLKKHFPDKDSLVVPVSPVQMETDEAELAALFCKENFNEDYRTLKQEVHKFGLAIPPMINAYMGLSPTMKIFGTAVNRDFGNVEETGLLIAVDELRDDKRMRYIESFARENPDAIKLTSGANKVFYIPGNKN